LPPAPQNYIVVVLQYACLTDPYPDVNVASEPRFGLLHRVVKQDDFGIHPTEVRL